MEKIKNPLQLLFISAYVLNFSLVCYIHGVFLSVNDLFLALPHDTA